MLFQAWHVIVGNALRLSAVNSIGDFILFLAKCLVTLIIGSAALFTFRSDSELHFHAIPIIIICIFAFFVAHCVISLHEVIFICLICTEKTFVYNSTILTVNTMHLICVQNTLIITIHNNLNKNKI